MKHNFFKPVVCKVKGSCSNTKAVGKLIRTVPHCMDVTYLF